MLRVKARAKINWTLDIIGTRPDGYHRMDMLMSSVELHDTLYLETAGELSLVVEQEAERPEGAPIRVPLDERNLVIKAARALRHALGEGKGASLRLVKRIPVGAGLGGGSADAAAAIIGLCALWGRELSLERLVSIGVTIGADVPFLLTGGLARVKGIGEILEPLPNPEPIWLVITQPCEGLSTREIFGAYDDRPIQAVLRPDTAQAQSALVEGDLPRLARFMGNVLEPVSLAKRRPIGQAVQALQGMGALRAMMTGSGSAVYGVFETEAGARSAWEALRGRWKRTIVTHTAGESITLERV